MGRVLGVDLGKVRVGLALSDPSGIVATPLETLRVGDGADAVAIGDALAAAAREHEATAVVVGLPRTLGGREGRPAQFARAVANRLGEKGDLEVHLWDERYTTVEAERTMLKQGAKRRQRRAAVDRVAATLLLQAFLDQRRRAGEDHG